MQFIDYLLERVMECIDKDCTSEAEVGNYCKNCNKHHFEEFQNRLARLETSSAPAYHTHLDERGMLVKCYHKSKAMVLSWEFWFATMITFPVEHGIWDYVPPFSYITKFLGL